MEQHTDLQEIIEYLNPAELDYQDWVNVGMALKHEGYSVDVWDTSNAEDNVELSLTFGLEGKGVDGYATVTAEQQEVAAYVFADTQKTGA